MARMTEAEFKRYLKKEAQGMSNEQLKREQNNGFLVGYRGIFRTELATRKSTGAYRPRPKRDTRPLLQRLLR